jgi:carboxyl-terminal processing protease
VGGAIASNIPVVVLVDRGSASASEITTGALRDRHRATIVGTRTFGKGLVQEVEPLSNGGALDITVANYYLPDGETIAPRKGLKPQVRARDNPHTHRDEALRVALDTLLRKKR